MKKIIILIFLILIKLSNTFAGDIFVSIQPGWGTYQMEDLKEIFDNVPKNYVIGVVTDDFPSYFNFSADAVYEIKPYLNAGLNFCYYSTGGRFHYKDYSGEVDYKSENNCFGIGPVLELQSKILNDKINVKYCISGGWLFSTMKMTDYMELNGTIVKNEKNEKDAVSFFIYPGLKLLWQFEQFNVGISAGYFLDFDDYYNGTDINTQWDGIRFAAVLETNISKLWQKFQL